MLAGGRLLHYEILAKLGEGGMGVVYKARDTHLDRFVAIKMLHPESLIDPARKVRFIQEAKAASALNHPNIVVVHDVASEKGADFIVMEYVSGRTLDQIIASKAMPPKQVLKIAIQISDALSRAHSAGIVHRDLKPSNVIIDEHGLVKLLDFGLAKLAEPETPGENVTATIRLKTSEGKIVGTAAYMSPEQAEGKPVDPRSDIFSFGEVLYEMVSGHRAFEGDNNMSVLASVINQAPEVLKGVPPDLERIINRCLRKDRSRRYQHMDDVKVDLEELWEESGSGKMAPSARQRRRTRWIWAGAALVVLAAAVASWLYLRNGLAVSEQRASVVPLTSYRGSESFPCFSPDGNQVAFVWTGERQDRSNIYVKTIGADTPLRLTSDPRPESSPAWSPDGRYIAFLRQEEPLRVACYLVPPTGGRERKVADLTGHISVVFRGLTWLPDSRRLLVGVLANPSWHQSGLQGLRAVSIDSGAQETWTQPEGPRGQDVAPSVSPDGRRIAFTRALDIDRSELFVMDVPADGAKPAAPERVRVEQPGAAEPVWTNDGRELIFTIGFSGQPSFWRAELSRPATVRRLELTGLNVIQPAISWKARRLAYTSSFLARPDIFRLALSGPGTATGTPEVLIASSQMDQNPVYSPDGSLIAFESARSGSAEIWIADKEGRNPVQITSLGTRPNSPVWSPDGRQIAFRCPVSGSDEVCVASTLGGPVRTVTNHPAQDRAEGWSPDGKWILFTSTRGGRQQTWRVPAASGEAEFVAEGGPGRLSSDGKTRFRVDPATSWITAEPTAGGTAERVAGPLMMGNWALTPSGIYFIPRADNRPYSVKYYDFRTKAIRDVARLTVTPGWGMAVSPDEQRMLITLSEDTASGSDLMMVENFR